jgi:branched-subunit amino acid aminotransferase/4-amino-4-deoxychorismate lyase
MSVFESFPIRGGVPLFMAEHLASLRQACIATGFDAPAGSLEACDQLLRGAPDGFARIYVTAGDGLVTGVCDDCRVIVLIQERVPVPAPVYHRGYDLALHAGSHLPVFAGLKTGNYWGNLRAFRDGVAAGRDETLLFTPDGQLISACMANVFLMIDGQLQTPAIDTGARAGIIRDWVMKQTSVRESLITRAEAGTATEIFLTNSWLGIMPAASIDGRALGQRNISSGLLEAYRTLLSAK